VTNALQRLHAEIRFDREAFEERLRELDDLNAFLANIATGDHG
jgi:hypothetical protein